MNVQIQPTLDFEAAMVAAVEGEGLIVDLDGYEGPLHVLLDLARSQKVDLLKLSVTRLADQYLAFVREARRLHFSLAADYLVMAAWLAFLKSRLLLPKAERPTQEAEAPEVAASQLAFRLAKLDAMRRAAEALFGGSVLRRDVFPRGDPESVTVVSLTRIRGDVRELMAAYVQPRLRGTDHSYRPKPIESYRLDDAREHLKALIPGLTEWTPLSVVAPARRASGPTRASYVASTLSASLEMVREGGLELRQFAPLSEVYLRAAGVA